MLHRRFIRVPVRNGHACRVRDPCVLAALRPAPARHAFARSVRVNRVFTRRSFVVREVPGPLPAEGGETTLRRGFGDGVAHRQRARASYRAHRAVDSGLVRSIHVSSRGAASVTMRARTRSARPILRCPRALRAAMLWIVLAAFLLAGQGVLPSADWLARIGMLQRSEERFPCEGCACGCISAEHCWTNCCCHSIEDRLAWARANGVLVPRAIARRAFAALQQASARANLPECCRAREDRQSGSATSSCCDAGGCGTEPHASRIARVRIASISALGCKGAPGWLVHAPLPPVVDTSASAPSIISRVVGCHAPRGDAAPESRTLEAPSPPPRA